MADLDHIKDVDNDVTYNMKDTTSRNYIAALQNDKMDKVDPTGSGAFSLNRSPTGNVGDYSVAEGFLCVASGEHSHAEGSQSEATGNWSHSEGLATVASSFAAHAEGASTVASGNRSHAEGADTVASAYAAHAEGNNTIAASHAQHVGGKFNVADSVGRYAEIIGNGDDDNNRSNARTLDWNGNETIAGDLYFNGGSDSLSDQLANKQATLVSGTNIKTINGASVLGSGNITTPDTKPTNHTNVGSGNVSVSNNTWTTLWNITIPKGEWIIQVAVAWQTAGGTSDNGTGFRTIELNDNSVNPGNAGLINTNTAQATTGSRTTQQMTCIVAPSSATTYTVYGRHNAGTGLQALPRIRYVKIG